MGSLSNTPCPALGYSFRRQGALLFFAILILLSLSSVFYYYRTFVVVRPHTQSLNQPSLLDIAPLPYTESVSHQSIAEILIATADFLKVLSTEHQIQSLDGLSKDLRLHASKGGKSSLVRNASAYLGKRGLLADIGSALGIGGSSTSGSGSIPSSIFSAFSSLLSGAVGSLAGPAQFLGDGLGRGAATGLQLNSTPVSTAATVTGIDAVAGNFGFGITDGLLGSINVSSLATNTTTIAAAGGALAMGLGGGAASGLNLNTSAIVNPTMVGVNQIANNFGSGLTQAFLGGADLSKLISGMNLSTAQVSAVVIAAGQGLGSGASQGLKLPTNPGSVMAIVNRRQTAETSSGIDLSTVAEDFTHSLSSSFLGSVDVKASLFQAAAGIRSNSTSGVFAMLGPSLAAAGTGLGSGAAVGLGLKQIQDADVVASGTDIPNITKDFTYQLSSSFLQNGTLDGLIKSLSSAGGGNIMAMLGPAAEGAGSGIGQGVAVGLGLRGADTVPASTAGNVAMVARAFTYSLTDSFLANGTVTHLSSLATTFAGNMSNSSSLHSIDISKAAEGLARGLVDGAGASINNAGGFQAILDGDNATAIMASSAVVSSETFNDTVGGVATGFGRGLGSEGVALVLQAFNPSLSAAQLAPSNTSVAARGLARRSSRPPLMNRAALDLQGVFIGANITAIDNLLDASIDALTCQGVGGIISIALGLISSKTLNVSLSSVSKLTSSLPNTTFTIRNEGNRFDINLGQKDIVINGVGIIKFAVLLVLHILLLIAAYFVALPLSIILQNSRQIALLSNRPQFLPNAQKWNTIIWATILPLSLISFIIGIVLFGDAKHFASAHGILGLITLLLTFVAGVLELPIAARLPRISKMELVKNVNMGLLIGLSNVALLTGFGDLGKISLCVTSAVIPSVAFLAIGGNVMFSIVAAVTLMGVRILMERWAARREEGEEQNGVWRGADVENRTGKTVVVKDQFRRVVADI